VCVGGGLNFDLLFKLLERSDQIGLHSGHDATDITALHGTCTYSYISAETITISDIQFRIVFFRFNINFPLLGSTVVISIFDLKVILFS